MAFSPFAPAFAASLSAHSLPSSFSHKKVCLCTDCTFQDAYWSSLTAGSCLAAQRDGFQPASGLMRAGAGRRPSTPFQGQHEERRTAVPGGRLFPAKDSSSQIRAVGCYFPGQKPQYPAARKLNVQMSAAVSPPWCTLGRREKSLFSSLWWWPWQETRAGWETM